MLARPVVLLRRDEHEAERRTSVRRGGARRVGGRRSEHALHFRSRTHRRLAQQEREQVFHFAFLEAVEQAGGHEAQAGGMQLFEVGARDDRVLAGDIHEPHLVAGS